MKENKLKFYRQNIKGLTQAKLALAVGITEQHYQMLEYCKAEPKVTLAKRLANALDVKIDDLFPLP